LSFQFKNGPARGAKEARKRSAQLAHFRSEGAVMIPSASRQSEPPEPAATWRKALGAVGRRLRICDCCASDDGHSQQVESIFA
jgi:hypothetical protein